MSYIGRIKTGQIPPPEGPVATLTGNTGGAVPPDIAGNINVVADATSFNGSGNAGPTGYLINGHPLTNELDVQPASYTLNIPPLTTGILFNFPVIVSSVVTISIEAAGIASDNAIAGGFFIGTAYNLGAGAVILTTLDQQMTDTAGSVLTWEFQSAAGNAQVLINNTSGTETWNFTAYIRYTTQPFTG